MGKLMLGMGGAALMLAGALAQAGEIPKEPRGPEKNIVITADLDFNSVWRNNLVDFSDDRVLTSRTSTQTAGAKTTATTGDLLRVSDADAATWVSLGLNFHADLGKDAYMAVQLNASDINNRTYGGTDGIANNAGSTLGGEIQFEVNLRQAYAHLNNFLIDKLSFRLGVQEMNEGLDRGNGTHFLLATGDLGHRHQIRNGGNVDYAFNAQGAQSTGATSADFTDMKNGANPGYGWKGSWAMDQGDNTLGFDVLWANLAETGTDSADSELFGIYGTYGFELNPKEKSAVTAHAANYRDGNIAPEEGPAAPADRGGQGSNIWAFGLGAQVRWQEVEVFGEFDSQSGDFDDGVAAGATSTTANNEEDHSASAFYLGGKYNFKDMMGDVTPWLEASLWSYSGDDKPADSDNDGYLNYGSVHETLIVEDNRFGMGLSNNYGVWRLKGGFSGIAAPMGLKGNLAIDGSYNSFTVKEDTIVAANSRTGVQQTQDDLGIEWDLAVRWGYAENISFALSFGWFMPGDAVAENVQLGGIAAAGGRASAANDDTVTLIRLDSSFRF